MKVQLDEATDAALRRNAARRGLSLSEYLHCLAIDDRPGEDLSAETLRARLRSHLDEAAVLEARPRTPATSSFAQAVRRKYREQGLQG